MENAANLVMRCMTTEIDGTAHKKSVKCDYFGKHMKSLGQSHDT